METETVLSNTITYKEHNSPIYHSKTVLENRYDGDLRKEGMFESAKEKREATVSVEGTGREGRRETLGR